MSHLKIGMTKKYHSKHPTHLTKGYNHERYGQLNLTRRDAMNKKADTGRSAKIAQLVTTISGLSVEGK